MKRLFVAIGISVSVCSCLFAQVNRFGGTNVTGQLVLATTVNLNQLAQLAQASVPDTTASVAELSPDELALNTPVRRFHPAAARRWTDGILNQRALDIPASRIVDGSERWAAAQTTSAMQSSTVTPASNFIGFNGLTHLDQRQANGGNQLSIEPPSPSIAVGNGYVLQGVNNALMVYTAAGIPLLPKVLSSNEFFVLPPAVNRAVIPNIRGPFPTDMRVFYDPGMNRFVALQWAQLRDIFNNLLDQSREYIGVSQTGDPTGNWNIYVMDTTNPPLEIGCPCIPDYPQLGADAFGLYISSNEYSTGSNLFLHASILAISKASLASGAATPTLFRFIVSSGNGFAFAIQPATTPPGASSFLASGGVEYFVSSQSTFATDQNMAVWAMANTGSLQTSAPSLSLVQITVPTLIYSFPDVARQRPGPTPFGSSLFPPGLLPFLDGGDTRILSLSYSGARLYATLQTTVIDDGGHPLVGIAYVILSPTFRGGVLNAFVLRQGYLLVGNNHLLRPSMAVNSDGRGAIVFTLVGPDYYPSAAYVLIDSSSTASTIQISAPGVLPEDGFSGYPNIGFPQQGVARWGDYSTAVAASDGSIWMATEFISNAPRTPLANWATFVTRVQP
jgi:hypothetical protein